MKLYEKLADDIERSIRQGVYRHGERLPSVRQTSLQHRLSITTVLRAYVLPESRGLLTSRPQSGYFVNSEDSTGEDRIPELRPSSPLPVSSPVDVSRLVLSTLRSIGVDEAVPLGSPYPDPRPFPFDKIDRYAYEAGRGQAIWGVTDALPPGNARLVRQIARRYLENGMTVDPNEIVITVGATEAINLCLQAVARPGDVIAVESPTYYAMLHAIERLGMSAIEVATHPESGIDVDALAAIVASQPIAACMVMLELPETVDSLHLYKLALEQDITIGPGYMFSIFEKSYRNFIRLNYSSPWTDEIEQAVITVGKLAARCARS